MVYLEQFLEADQFHQRQFRFHHLPQNRKGSDGHHRLLLVEFSQCQVDQHLHTILHPGVMLSSRAKRLELTAARDQRVQAELEALKVGSIGGSRITDESTDELAEGLNSIGLKEAEDRSYVPSDQLATHTVGNDEDCKDIPGQAFVSEPLTEIQQQQS